jgi:lambda family phage tail tape measure protein
MADIARIGIEIDTRSMEQGMKKLGLLGGESKKTEKATDRLSKSFKRMVSSAKRAGTGAMKLGKKIASLAKNMFSLKGLILTIGIGYLAKQFIDAAASAERLRIRLDAFTKGQGAAYFDKLNKWVALLPVNTEEAIDAFTKLQAYGIKPTTDLMTTLVDTVTALGGQSDSLTGIARALGQIQTKGRVSAEEINQLAEQGVNARKYLSEAFNLLPSAFNELDKAIKETGATTQDAIDAIFSGMNKEFGGMAERIKNSWQGLMNRLIHQWFNFRRITMESGLFQFMKSQLQEFLEFVESPAGTKAMKEWAKKISGYVFDATEFMIKSFKGVIIVVSGIAEEVTKMFKKIKMMPLIGDEKYKNYIKAKNNIDSLRESQQKALKAYAKATSELKTSAFPGQVEERIGFLEQVIDTTTQKIVESRKKIDSFEKESPLFKESEKQANSLRDTLLSVLEDALKASQTARQAFKGGITSGEIIGGGSVEDLERMMTAAKKYDELQDRLDPKRKMFRSFSDEAEILRDAYIFGLIPSLEELNKKMRELRDSYPSEIFTENKFLAGAKSSFKKYSDSVKDVAGQTEQLFTNSFSRMEDAIVQFATTGKASFKDFANSVISDITRILIRQSITGPLAEGLGNLDMFNFSQTPAITNKPRSPSSKFQTKHSGGLVGEGNTFKSANPAVFNNAPKYHNGGIAGDEVPAILQRGEGVFTKDQMKAMGGTNVQIIDQRTSSASEQIQTQETTGRDGKKTIQVIVRDEVRAANNTGAFDRTMKGNYGVSRRPVRR